MIKWKQRLYAFLLRRVLGPFLDAASQQKLHDSIEVSFQEGTFTLNNVGLSTTYLNTKAHKAGVHITKARVESISIQLTLLEGQQQQVSQNGGAAVTRSSLAWRAMNLGISVSLLAHVEIDGIQLEVEPLPSDKRKQAKINETDDKSVSSSTGDNSDTEEPASSASKGVLSSYIEAALSSLQLTLNLTNLSVQICQPAAMQGSTAWVELRLPSLSYQDMDASKSNSKSSAPSSSNDGFNSLHGSVKASTPSPYQTIMEKSVIFQGMTVAAGEMTRTGSDSSSNISGSSCGSQVESSSLVSVIALAEGTGHISLRALKYESTSKKKSGQVTPSPQVQQDIDVRLNQQIKISVDETSLLQLQAIVEGFGDDPVDAVDGSSTASRDSTHRSLLGDSACSAASGPSSGSINSREDELELYTINGMMKQYNEARLMAEQNQMRGGMLVPSNAYEEGENVGAGDPRTFDVFFDANDKSFHHYASVMKNSMMASQDMGSLCNFVHTKLRFHLLGGGMKLSFRNRTNVTESLLGPDEYILLKFNDVDITSKVSGSGAEYALQVSHMEIDDAHMPHTDISSVDDRRIEIGSLLSFTQEFEDDTGGGDVLVQPACVSMYLNINTKVTGPKSCDFELNLTPIELAYRRDTIARVTALAVAMGYINARKSDELGDSIQLTEDRKNSNPLQINSFLCSVGSLTVSVPVLEQRDFSPLYTRCGYSADDYNSTRSALGLVFDNLTIENKRRDGKAGKINAEPVMTTSIECHSIICFASSPENSDNPVGRTSRRFDILAATGRCEVDPCIPIAMEYRLNSRGQGSESNFGKETFPMVPAFSSFKARQEDEDEDAEIDRILAEKLRDVNVDSRGALRAKDPQNEMLDEAGKRDSVIMVHIPEVMADVSRNELEALLGMLHCVIPQEKGPSGASSASPSLSISVAWDAMSLSVHSQDPSIGRDTWNSHVLKFERCRAHTITGGSSMKFIRFLAHETALYEMLGLEACKLSKSPGGAQSKISAMRKRSERTDNSSAAPLFYRSKLFPALSQGSPAILLDYVQPRNASETQMADDSEQSVYLSIYNMTYRYNPDSKWWDNLRAVFRDLEFKGNASPPDAAGETTTSPSDLASLTRVFFSLADCNFDYTSLRYFNTTSRSILRIGDLRLSSNIMTPAVTNQAFSLSIGDISWYLCNTRCPHNFENSLLPGSLLILAPADLTHTPLQRSESQMAPRSELVFREMGFKTILTLESIDAILAKSNHQQPTTKTAGGPIAREPQLTISLTFGELSIYACKDSFRCFAESISELQTKLTAFNSDDIRELRKLSPKKIAESNNTRSKAFSKRNVHAIPMDSKADYLLDGYDWTTIDHDFDPVREIPPGQEQTARWYNSPDVSIDVGDHVMEGDSHSEATSGPRLIHQHFPLHVVSDPLRGGDMDASKFAGTDEISVNTHILLHDLKIKLRLFDGYDWPEFQSQRKRNPKALFVIDDVPVTEDATSSAKGNSKSSDKPGRKAELMGGLLAGAPDSSGTFNSLPLPEERVKSLISQNEIRYLSRRTNSYVQFSAQGVSLRLDSYCASTKHRLKSCLDLALKDFFLAETISNSNPVKMIGEWFNETEHPRDSSEGLLMFKMVTWGAPCRLTSEDKLASEECEVALTLAPVRCILDQRAIKFKKAFFRDDSIETEPTQDWTQGLHQIPPPKLRIFRVKPVKMKIDYSPQKIDTVALKNGSVVELINLSPLDAMVLVLHDVEVQDSVGFGEAMGSLVSHWLGDVCATQMHKFLTNARPFEPITNVGGGVSDLLVLPWDAYKNGESVSRALRSSVSSLVGTVAHETLTTSSRITAFIAGEMSKASNSAPSSLHHSGSSSSNSTLPSRPLGTPHRVGDTAGHALESLARGVQTANYKVIIVPYREYCRSGTRGAVKSIIKGIPIAVAAPVSGASEALSYTLLGARNQIRPDLRKEEEASQRGLHYGGP